LNPEFNVWDHITPYARKLVAEESRSIGEFWLEELQSFFRALFTYPKKVNDVLVKIERGEISVQTPDLVKEITRLEKAMGRVVMGIVFAAFFLGAVQVYLAGDLIPSLGLGLLAFLSLIGVFIRRNGGL
jgi:predicted unusual protein kinase regulating ubiquinone biosynthesis (AarF/ABC1/UbiB family)